MAPENIEETLRQQRLEAKRKQYVKKLVHKQMAGTALGEAHDNLPENLSPSDRLKPAEGPYNYINPETGEYQRERPGGRDDKSGQQDTDKTEPNDKPASPTNDSPQPAPDQDAQQEWLKKQIATGADGQAITGANVDRAGSYSDDPKTKKEQKQKSQEDIEADYRAGSMAARRGKDVSQGPGKGKNMAGKAAGAAISAMAESGGPLGSVLIYGLALLNDFPDLAQPYLDVATVGLWMIVDFLFDAVVFLGFRYFLRKHLNIPGMKLIFYGCAIAELLPIPVFNPDILPFWTICAWLALRKIKQKQADDADQARQAQKSMPPNTQVEQKT